jgi:catechol 2,3-dioxygenase-like lactoylglutathione lyase family enzyme
MPQAIAAVALVVPDYDEAIAYYTEVFGFELIEDSALGDGKRGGRFILLSRRFTLSTEAPYNAWPDTSRSGPSDALGARFSQARACFAILPIRSACACPTPP